MKIQSKVELFNEKLKNQEHSTSFRLFARFFALLNYKFTFLPLDRSITMLRTTEFSRNKVNVECFIKREKKKISEKKFVDR